MNQNNKRILNYMPCRFFLKLRGLSSSPLRGEGRERVIELIANTSGVLEVIRERLNMTPSPQSPPLKGGEVITHFK